MDKNGFLYRAIDLYVDGFRKMTIGKTLWAVIIVKLIVIFVIVKWLFFPNYIDEHAEDGQEAEYVANEMLDR